MKINWFSPLLPARTDIAHYTARILPALKSSAQITLWTHQPEWDRELENHARVRRIDLRRPPGRSLIRRTSISTTSATTLSITALSGK